MQDLARDSCQNVADRGSFAGWTAVTMIVDDSFDVVISNAFNYPLGSIGAQHEVWCQATGP